MAEAIALQVVVLHLADALGPQRLPRQVLARAPAALRARHARRVVGGAGPVAPGMVLQRVLAQRRQFVSQLPAHRHREGRGDADVLQHAGVVVQAQQQRAHGILAVAVPAKARHHAIGGARVLDLEHRALAGLVGRVLGLGDHAVQARRPRSAAASRAPRARSRVIGVRYTGGVDAGPAAAPAGRGARPAAAPWSSARRPPAGRRRRRPPASPAPAAPRARRPDAAAAAGRRNPGPLAPTTTISPSITQPLGSACASARSSSGKVAVQRPQVAALEVDLVAVAKHQRAKAVPLGLEQEAALVRKLIGDLGQHGFDRRRSG